jgi:hypothetical protein
MRCRTYPLDLVVAKCPDCAVIATDLDLGIVGSRDVPARLRSIHRLNIDTRTGLDPGHCCPYVTFRRQPGSGSEHEGQDGGNRRSNRHNATPLRLNGKFQLANGEKTRLALLNMQMT